MNGMRIRLAGGFYAFILLDAAGAQPNSLADACEAAEEMYGPDWRELYDGSVGITRNEYIEQKAGGP